MQSRYLNSECDFTSLRAIIVRLRVYIFISSECMYGRTLVIIFNQTLLDFLSQSVLVIQIVLNESTYYYWPFFFHDIARNAESIGRITSNERLFVSKPYHSQCSHHIRDASRKRCVHIKTRKNQFRRFGWQRNDQKNK